MRPVEHYPISGEEAAPVYSGTCQEKVAMMTRAERRAFLRECGELRKTKRVRLKRKEAPDE